jgi:hypothetical protein
MMVYAGVLALLTAAWLSMPKSISRCCRPLATQVSPPPPDWYLGYFNGDVDHSVVYNNLDGFADSLKRADVLFLGNSRMQYAFRNQDILRQFFSSRSLTYYNLAFGYGEGQAFPEAIIRKFDLHPKWVIVNADPFFGKLASPVASEAISFGYLGAWKSNFEADESLLVQRGIHRIFPYLALSQWDLRAEWIYYRAKRDGTVRVAAWRATPRAMWLDNSAGGQPLRRSQIAAAESFRKELSARGAELVLTAIPPSSGKAAQQLSSLLRVPLIAAQASGLATIDGSHLDDDSSKRFSVSFLDALAKIVGPGRK